MADARLLISSRNYSSWSLRGWLLCRLAGLEVEVSVAAADDPVARAELLMRSSSILLPCLIHGEVTVWDTLAIAEYLNETFPKAGLLPENRAARARSRSISGEMHSGFSALRSSLPMNLRAHVPDFTLWSGPKADIDRILTIWNECLEKWGGPWLFGARPGIADAMYAPVVTRFLTYGVRLDGAAARYADTIMSWPDMAEWVEAAKVEPEHVTELDLEAEF